MWVIKSVIVAKSIGKKVHCVVLTHSHGPNRFTCDETPYPPTRSWFIIFYGSLCFLLRSFLLLSWGSLGEASQGFILLAFIFCQLLLPSGPLAPSSHKVRYNPLICWPTQCLNQCMGWMKGKKMKSGKYGGRGRWNFMNPPVETQTLWEPAY